MDRSRSSDALKLPPGMPEKTFYGSVCPPLPANFAIPEGEPVDVLSADTREFRFHARHDWTDEQWRLHRWAYSRLTELADKEIGQVLATLHETGLDKNTLVVFTTDLTARWMRPITWNTSPSSMMRRRGFRSS